MPAMPEQEARPCLLVVEDDQRTRELLRQVLEREGFKVLLATDGEEALERLAESPIDLVLTDLRMPRMGGQQLLEEIRRRGLKPLVIAMTAFDEEGLSAEAWKLGVVAFLQKPFGMAELLEAIARGLLDTFY